MAKSDSPTAMNVMPLPVASVLGNLTKNDQALIMLWGYCWRVLRQAGTSHSKRSVRRVFWSGWKASGRAARKDCMRGRQPSLLVSM